MGTFRLAETSSPADPNTSFFHRATRMLPGIIAGAADLDPAAVLTATVAGASFGTSLGWVVVLCIPVLFSIFAVSSRIGQETRKGLVQLIREHYSARTALITISPRIFFLAIVGFTVWYVLIIGNYQKTTKVLGLLTLILVAYVVAA